MESTSKGLRLLDKDLIFCLERIEDDNSITLSNPALLSNIVKRLPEKFRIEYVQHALHHYNTIERLTI